MSAAALERTQFPPVTCAPWCVDGDGHPGEFCRADQWCRSESISVGPLLSEYRVPDPYAYRLGRALARETEELEVYLRRTPGCLDEVILFRSADDTDVSLTPDEARRLAGALLAQATVAEGRA